MGGVANFVGGLFGANTKSKNTSTVTARDILPSTESKTPDSAIMGSSDSFATTMSGKESLKIQTDQAATTQKKSYSGVYNYER